MKTCTKCLESKPLDAFYRDKGSKDGREHRCKVCTSNRQKQWYKIKPEKAKEQVRCWRKSNPEKVRRQRRKEKYGLLPLAYEVLKASGLGVCDICGRPRKLNIDHDHATGRVRGLLCRACNMAIGHLSDSPAIFRSAAEYLELHAALAAS